MPSSVRQGVAGVALGDIYDHLVSFHMAGMAQSHICDIHLGFTDHLTHIFVTHYLSHTIFHTDFAQKIMAHLIQPIPGPQ